MNGTWVKRSAQSVFNGKGFSKDESDKLSDRVVAVWTEKPEQVTARYGSDPLDVGEGLAQDLLEIWTAE